MWVIDGSGWKGRGPIPLHELSKEYYNINYLDRFFLDEDKDQNVSAILPTYNRAPYPPSHQYYKRNPLLWSVGTILKQKPKISQLIIINDGSTDYTEDVIKNLKSSKTEIVYLRNRKRIGSPKSRNIGMNHASHDIIYFIDDDCAIAPYTIWGGVYALEKTRDIDPNICAINLPVYNRSTIPLKIVSKTEIGKIDFENGIITSNFDSYPIEYIYNPEFIDKEKKILKPFKIKNLCGHLVCYKDPLMELRFPEFFQWENSYGEETELGCRINDRGYSAYFSPDPKFHGVHGRYGLPGRHELNGHDWAIDKNILVNGISLQEMINESEKARKDTGNRVEEEEWYYSKIRSFFEILSRRSEKAGINWAISTYKDFVLGNNGNFGYYTNIKNPKKRYRLWKNAILDSIKEDHLFEKILERIEK